MLWQWLLFRCGSNWFLWKGLALDGWEQIELRSVVIGMDPVPFFKHHVMDSGAPLGEIRRAEPERWPEFSAVVPLARPLWHEESGVMSLLDTITRQLANRPSLIPAIDLPRLPTELRDRVAPPVTLREPIQACASCGRRDAGWTSSGAVRVCNQMCSDEHWERFHM
jgi:hypothetical protein